MKKNKTCNEGHTVVYFLKKKTKDKDGSKSEVNAKFISSPLNIAKANCNVVAVDMRTLLWN